MAMATATAQGTRFQSKSNNKRSDFDSKKREAEKWAEIWFTKLCQFHKLPRDCQWQFNSDHVIQFLQAKVKDGFPAWKRRKIVENLVSFQRKANTPNPAELRFIISKLKQIESQDKRRSSDEDAKRGKRYTAVVNAQDDSDLTEEEIVGKINPREPDTIQQLRRKLRLVGHAYNTELAYVKWVRRFLKSRGVVSLEDCQNVSRKDVEAFLTDLVVDGNVAPSTQDQAFYAIQFLFDHVLEKDIGKVDALRSKKAKLIPTVMSKEEVSGVLAEMDGLYLVIAQLLYGCGLRISEALRLRVKDFDFDQRQITVFCSKGKKSRLVPLPELLVEPLKRLIGRRRTLHEHDVDQGIASVWLPHALQRKLPKAAGEFRWQFLFASARFSKDPQTGRLHRHHLHRDSFTRALRRAADRSGILKYITAHTFRHSFATHLLQAKEDLRTIQELLGHADISTTAIYTHVLIDKDAPVISPLDRLTVAA